MLIKEKEVKELEGVIAEACSVARAFGLDFYPMRFEVVPADIIYTFGAYGMPSRYNHWSFGKSFFKLKTLYDYNLSRIYELVINTNPCYAFLLSGNSLIQNKLVIAHALAHSDFFKNNAYFTHTSTTMIDTMTNAAERIRNYEFKYGKEIVEDFLDACISIQENIDPIKARNPAWKTEPIDEEKDLLLYLAKSCPHLEEWQLDIITTVRNEMIYFWPQLETKIVNEGWATFWHLRIMREINLIDSEIIEFAKMHANVIRADKKQLNPYSLGLKLWEDIFKKQGYSGMFEVREMESDLSFIRNYLTQEIIEDLDLYLFRKEDRKWKVTETQWEAVREGIVGNLINCGFPNIVVADGNYNLQGELFMRHIYEGVELDIKHLEKTLPYVYHIWQKPVHLETVLNNKGVIFYHDGTKTLRKFN